MGYAGVTGVRQGKRFELEVEEPLTQAQLERIYDLAEKLLSNPVIEDFEVSILEPGQGVEADADMDVMW
jgi:phosphoribosylformylglycinamidine synthase